MRALRLPLTYGESRARFRRACSEAGVSARQDEIAARGPAGEVLTIDSAWIGEPDVRSALVVLSGVHGVEGFLPSVLQCGLLGRLTSRTMPSGVGVLLVHAVNPWGMAWWRRQNESNVDLNRNWRRDEVEPRHNHAYDEIHPLVCPDDPSMPDAETLLRLVSTLVEERGLEWVRDAITVGQYRHPDGLHFGGDRTEESCRTLEDLVTTHLSGVERLLALDLHTGHGPWGAVTFLCDRPPGSDRHRFLAEVFGKDRVEATTGNREATTALKVGQIANGFGDLLPGTLVHATSVEWGTADDLEQLAATYEESWVHRWGDREDPAHRAAVWRYRECFSPDDPAWEEAGLTSGAELLTAALDAVCDWSA